MAASLPGPSGRGGGAWPRAAAVTKRAAAARAGTATLDIGNSPMLRQRCWSSALFVFRAAVSAARLVGAPRRALSAVEIVPASSRAEGESARQHESYQSAAQAA